MEFFFPQEGRMDGRPEVDIVTMLPFRALKRQHHNVERTAVGGSGDLQVLVDDVDDDVDNDDDDNGDDDIDVAENGDGSC